jgi:UDPglucose 6-dehydrogenase
VMKDVYRPLYLLETPIVNTTPESAEMIKYASNAYLATKISFINEIAAICERTGATVDDVARGVGLDGRIGSKFLHAGVGYGGSCLPKDVTSLIYLAREKGYEPGIIAAVHGLNAGQVDRTMDKLSAALGGIEGKTVGLFGLSFKPNTDDLREAPSLGIVAALSAGGATIKTFDPIAMDNFRKESPVPVEYYKNAYDCAEDSDAVVLVTEWNEFRELDFERLAKLMRGNVFIDCRNVYKPERVESYGFKYDSFGRGPAGGKE